MTAIRTFSIGKTKITLVGKYRYSKKVKLMDKFTDWRDWRISIWFKRSEIVGKKNFKDPNEWGNNLVNSYMLGIDFLIIKGWIEWHTGGMVLEIKDDK